MAKPPALPPAAQPVDPAWAPLLWRRLRVPEERWAKLLCISFGPVVGLAVFYFMGAYPDLGKAIGPSVGAALGAAMVASYWLSVLLAERPGGTRAW